MGKESEQYDTFTSIAYKFDKEHDGKDITFIGHSLGGGLAAAAALKTGESAITFNPALLHENTKKRYGLTENAKIYNIVIDGEILGIQSVAGMRYEGYTKRLYSPMGTFVKTPIRATGYAKGIIGGLKIGASIYLHTMTATIPLLKKELSKAKK